MNDVHGPCPLDLFLRPDEQCVALTRDYRLIQPYKGHKYSVDDLLVAALAARQTFLEPKHVLDLGCGLGSVLLMTAWIYPRAEFVGVEAQHEHVAFARRNVLLNGCTERVEILQGDLRDEKLLGRLGAFDLVTGTPPYFDPASSTVCANPQRAYAQWELRGGIEEYARAAAQVLNPEGMFVACAPADPLDRARNAVEKAGMFVHYERQVLPKPGRKPFLWLVVAGKKPPVGSVAQDAPLLLRHEDGARTEEHAAARSVFGLPSSIY